MSHFYLIVSRARLLQTQATQFKRGSEGEFLLGHLVFAQMLYRDDVYFTTGAATQYELRSCPYRKPHPGRWATRRPKLEHKFDPSLSDLRVIMKRDRSGDARRRTRAGSYPGCGD